MAVASLSSYAAATSPLLRPASGRPWRLLLQSCPSFPSSYSSSSSLTNPRAVHHHRSPRFLCAAQSPVPEPPPPEDPVSGLQVVLSRIQGRVQIFFAVFFWLSLLFWGSIWNGRGSSRKKKGPWSRKFILILFGSMKYSDSSTHVF